MLLGGGYVCQGLACAATVILLRVLALRYNLALPSCRQYLATTINNREMKIKSLLVAAALMAAVMPAGAKAYCRPCDSYRS